MISCNYNMQHFHFGHFYNEAIRHLEITVQAAYTSEEK